MNTIFLVFSVRNTVAFSIATIAQWDWPDHWPQLFDILMQVSLLCRLCLCLSLYGSLCVGLSLFLCYDAPRTSSLYKVRFVSTRSSLSLYFFSFPLSISIFLISFNSLRTRLWNTRTSSLYKIWYVYTRRSLFLYFPSFYLLFSSLSTHFLPRLWKVMTNSLYKARCVYSRSCHVTSQTRRFPQSLRSSCQTFIG